MLVVGLGGVDGRRAHPYLGEQLVDGLHQHFGVGRLQQDPGHAARLGERPGLGLLIDGRVEDDRGRRGVRCGAQLPGQLVPVHPRHQDVGEHQVGVPAVRESEGLRALMGLDHLVTAIGQQDTGQFPVDGAIVDDQDG
jgi:hypothetical protein